MILLWGIATDGPLAAVRAAIDRQGEEVVFLDQHETLQTGIELTVDGAVGGRVRLPAGEVLLESVSAVYIRAYDSRRLPAVRAAGPDSPAWRRALLLESVVSSWTEIAPAFVVSRPSAMASNNSKPFQALRIREQGFDVPDTLVTTDPAAAAAFQEKHGTVIYKSTSGVRSIVSRLGSQHADRLADIASCPTQFQQYVAGTDVRVHVVGDDVFACEVLSRADDYRHPRPSEDDPRGRPYPLPVALADRCRALASALGLPVAGIDLRRCDDDRWYCFEVNPSPGFTLYEGWTGHPIAEAIGRLLAVGSRAMGRAHTRTTST